MKPQSLPMKLPPAPVDENTATDMAIGDPVAAMEDVDSVTH